MSKQAVRFVISAFGRRFHLPVALLALLLQRAPLLRTALVSETALAAPVSALLRSILASSAFGAYHALAGATQFTSNPSSPASATVGQPFALVFSVIGAPASPQSFEITGTPPPGLIIPNMNGDTLNATAGTITGTPTTPGSYQLFIRAWNSEDKFGDGGNPTFTLQINVQPGAASGPIFTAQPSDITIAAGDTAVFNATATGAGTITYQWFKDNVSIPGATASTLTVPNADASSAGAYRVTATSPSGSTPSASATLTVTQPLAAPSIVTAPANRTATAGETVTFTVAAEGTAPLSFQWFKNGVAIGSATSSSLTLTTVQLSNAGAYTVRISNPVSSITSAPATLTVNPPSAPGITTPPAAQVVTVGGNASFTVTANGSAPFTYQWLKNGLPITGATSATFSLSNVKTSDAGNYAVTVTNGGGSSTSAAATLTVNLAPTPPVIVTTPASQAVAVGSTALLTVSASGTAPFTYQWYRSGVPITGATNASLSLNNVQLSDAGSYSVAIYNSAGSIVTPPATLAVAFPPTLLAAPESRSVLVGTSVTFSVSTDGTAPFTYQWKRGGVPITGATYDTLDLNSAQVGNAGNYTVTVANAVGSVTSPPATLTVTAPSAPSIVTQPVSRSVNVGSSVTFSVGANGNGPLTYQWFRNGAPIPGATGATLTLGNTQISDSGNYSVNVSNAYGSVVSATIPLEVTTLAPAITSRISNVSVRTTLAANQGLTVGLTMSGGAKSVLLRAVGPSLGIFGVSNAMPDPRLRVYREGSVVNENDNWGGVAGLAAGFASTGAFALPDSSLDAAVLMPVDGGRTVEVNGSTAGNVLVEAYDAGSGNTPRLVNVSARNRVGIGGDLLIAGFAIEGTTPKTVLIRAIGPTLAGFGVPGTLADPKLIIFSGQTQLAENDNWSPDLTAAFASVGAFALTPGSKDAAIILSLAAGSYTAQVSGADGGTGEAMIEIYEYQP